MGSWLVGYLQRVECLNLEPPTQIHLLAGGGFEFGTSGSQIQRPQPNGHAASIWMISLYVWYFDKGISVI